MEQLKIKKLPARSSLYLLICISGILGFILLGIYPGKNSSDRLDMEINRLKAQIEVQKIFRPVYKALLKNVRLKDPEVLPFPKKAKLGHDKRDTVPNIFEEMGRRSNLEIVNTVPDVKSLSESPGLLSVNSFMKGNFSDFRNFLTHLGELPYLEHIEKIQIQAAQRHKEFRVRVWLALEK